MQEQTPTLRAEKDHGQFAGLYRASGLELGEDWLRENHPVYSVSLRAEGRLLGAATVSHRLGRYILDYIAMEPRCRGLGLGKRLAEDCLDWCRRQGAAALWLAARTPGFFYALGAEATGGRELLAECVGCPDYETICRPIEMKFEI